jgi:nucleotidyltransferase substrate binding protein (TIGR01987 family)
MIDFSSLKKARDVFEDFRQGMLTDRDRAGAIQAFEFSYELAWKMMKRVLAARGQETGSPKDIFRKAAIEKIIDKPELWFEFQSRRNVTVHTYRQENMNYVLEIFDQFSEELSKLITILESLEL